MKFLCIPASLFACKNAVIEQLDFSQLRLEQIPKEITKSRKHIEELLLNVNSIEELPPDLFRCTKIRLLDVSENKIKVIPPEIGTLQSLEELYLSKNEIVEIPEEIGFCQNLAVLDVSTNIVTGFPRSFVNLSRLSSLNLSNNSLTHLPQDIDRLINLQFLDVAQCELRSLPASIVRLERLKVLDLCDNYLTELPANMNGMASLEMLDLHCNMIGRLPEELFQCHSLKTLDLSGNQLNELPPNIGELRNLVELVLCENQIRQIPSTIGQLKQLEILKASKNCLSELTPSICSCSHLTDLILCENQLSELPASIGNLRRLRFLDVNVNNLQSIPSTIGGCQSLGILSLRHNQLDELPMEIGKLYQLQVLDVADNNLKYLPYTLTVLYQAKTLSALWLSFNQVPLPKLSITHEPVMNIKVLTCYLLPQKEAQHVKRSTSKSCVGGARVCFAGERREEEDEGKIPIGKFERYDTPHPKPFAPKNRPNNRNSGDFTGTVPPMASLGTSHTENVEKSPPDPAAIDQSRPLRSVLKRRPQSVLSQISHSELNALLNGGAADENVANQQKEGRKLIRKNIQLRKGANGFQWKIIGGADSLPYKGKIGLFISHLVEGGVAEAAGFQVDDQLLACNGEQLRGLKHRDAIELIQRGGDQIEFLIERENADSDKMLKNASAGMTDTERPSQYGANCQAPSVCASAFSELTLAHSLASNTASNQQHAPTTIESSANNTLSSSPPHTQPSAKLPAIEPHQPLPHHHHSTPKILQTASTSIENQQGMAKAQQRMENQNALPMLPPARASQPASTSFPVETNRSPQTSSPALSSKMVNPIPNIGASSKSSPDAKSSSTSSFPSDRMHSEGAAANIKIPPPVAPKPKAMAFSSSSDQMAVVNEHRPSVQSTSFSSKLKHFEQLQTTNGGERVNENGNEMNGTHFSASSKPSGIPLNKPLVSAHDMEKLKEAEELRKGGSRKNEGNAIKEDGEEEEDEHRDTVRELANLLGEQHNNGNGGITQSTSVAGPSVIRTKKTELRAERAASALDSSWNSSAEDGSKSLNSSLSQRATEIEKRREWRQARLLSMDLESKRTDNLVKLIADTAGVTPTGTKTTVQQTVSPIPAGP